MRNLFICHSQSHLILSSGLSNGRFANDENHIILFKDFNLKEELKERLVKVFDSALFLDGAFPASKNMTWKGRVKWYMKDIKILRSALYLPFDRVFAVCDWTYPVQYAIKRTVKNNSDVEVNWLEDGILPYFANLKSRKGLDKYSFTMSLRKIFIKYIMGIGKIYDRDFDEMGGLSVFKKAYVSYPEATREPYKSKKQLVSISSEEFQAGVALLYQKVDLDVPDGAILLVMDKLDTYLFPEKVQNVLEKFLVNAQKNNTPVYCKLHPREDVVWDVLDHCRMLDKTVSSESIYLSLAMQKDRIRVFGIKSAGLMTAVKMGFNVFSLFHQCGETNTELEIFFESIGVLHE